MMTIAGEPATCRGRAVLVQMFGWSRVRLRQFDSACESLFWEGAYAAFVLTSGRFWGKGLLDGLQASASAVLVCG